jgi:hypothetical protein
MLKAFVNKIRGRKLEKKETILQQAQLETALAYFGGPAPH